ncbi:uncharacterized protein LOC124161114 isoform X2 [Ischnura elegans]|uniref:uncharacterized protein LOC124161114 isoform X2 n=1 Tax=Ischnura elegans TaxID=197161 RepID=UPI001ED88FFD|nr:uncharacterized protein LOC124161114 isoform X2 [Ischnura elegans]
MSIKDEGSRKRLILLVRERRQLWDPKDPKYKDPKDTQKSWMEIGQLCRNTPERCQRTWKYLRDFYLAKRKKPPTSEIGKKETWAFMDVMRFIDDVSKALPKQTETVNNFFSANIETESSTYESSSVQEVQDDPINHIEIVEDAMPAVGPELSITGSMSPTVLEDPHMEVSHIRGRYESRETHKNFKKAILHEMRRGKDPDFQWLTSLYPLLKEFKNSLKKERVKLKIHALLLESLEEQSNNCSQ